MIKLVGKIKRCGGSYVLICYSQNLVKRVIEIGNKVSLELFEDGLILKKQGSMHASIGAKKWLQITVTDLLKEGIIKKENIGKDFPIYLNKDEWNLEDILKKSIGSPLTKVIPNNLVSKKAALRTNGQQQFFIDVSIKKLYELAKEKPIKCLINRTENDIILVQSDNLEARRLTPHSNRRIQIAIPKYILKQKELESLSKKKWLPIELKLDIESFGLKTEDFYSVREEKEIARYLIEKNIKIKIKNISDPYDIYLPDYYSCIEIHNSTPGYGDLVTRHKIRPAMVRLRILEAISLIKMGKINNFFLVFNEEWSKGKYIRELMENITKKVHVIYTNFKDDWYETVGKEILDKINP